MSSAIYSTETDPPEPTELVSLTVEGLCRLLRLGPTAIPALAEREDIEVRLPPATHGYCPQLGDVRIVRMRRSLTEDAALLAELRAKHPPERPDSHLNRMNALGGVLRVLGR